MLLLDHWKEGRHMLTQASASASAITEQKPFPQKEPKQQEEKV